MVLINTLKATISKRWVGFCNTTTLHGFAYIVNAERLWEKVFWSLLVAALVGLCIRDTSDLIDKFNNEETFVEFQLGPSATLVDSPPQFGICIEKKREDVFI